MNMLKSGTRNVPRRAWVRQPLLAFCHFNHDFAHDLTSALIRGQTNLSVNRRIEAFAALNMPLREDDGTYGRTLPVLFHR